MRTIETKVYQYDELSSEAKVNAINSLRDRLSKNRIEFEADDYRFTLKKIEEIFGVKVRDWSVDGYSPTYFRFYFVNLDEDIENEPKFLLRYLNRDVLPYIDCRKTYYAKNHYESHKKRKSRILSYPKYDFCITGAWTDIAVDDALNNIKESIMQGKSAREFVSDMLDNFFNRWNKDCEYAYSDESIEDEIVVNEYEFLENGKPYLS